MLTFFTTAKPNIGKNILPQNNSINSWLNNLSAEIIIYGNDNGVENYPINKRIKFIKDVKVNEKNIPFISDIFKRISYDASGETLIYSNADIIFPNNVSEIIEAIDIQEYMAIGRRYDANVTGLVDTNNKEWLQQLKNDKFINLKLHRASGIDYFIFPNNVSIDMPDLLVGRPGWDNWLVDHMLRNNVPVIDLTPSMGVVHQNHEITYRLNDRECIENFENISSIFNLGNVYDANLVLVNGKLIKDTGFLVVIRKSKLFKFLISYKRMIFNKISKYYLELK